MNVDLVGRINNTKLPLSNGLYPLFEAISNSIHAIEEAKEKKGRIEIVRPTVKPGLFGAEPAASQSITGFVVTDNGVGFTDTNFKSFQTSDSTRKQTKGGKGVGRFLWLKAFDTVEVESVFQAAGKWHRRTFGFRLTASGVEDDKLAEATEKGRRTTVRLIGFRAEYRQHPSCPRAAGTVARRIVEHFLGAFVLGTCPSIRLTDHHEKTDIDLTDLFAREMRLDARTAEMQVKGQKFKLTHVRLLAPQEVAHSLWFCAHNRLVRTEPLPKLLPNLETVLTEPDGDRKFVYAGYLAGHALDTAVNAERTRFEMFDQTENTVFAGELCWQDIVAAAVGKARDFLEPFTRPLNEAKREQVKQFVAAEAPQYRPLLKHKPERIDALRSNLSKDQLDVELYKIGQEWDSELRTEYRKLLADGDGTAKAHADHRRRYERFIEEWNEAGVAKLARYVIHRKATLDFLDERRGLKADGKYPLEDAIHEIVFPLRKTNEDVRVENTNLWIIDEKLAYHYYLASDKPLNQIGETVEVESLERPDLLIFDRPIAFAENGPPFSAIVIVEFKRPARDDYGHKEEKNPVLQVYGYIELLKEGKAKDRRGVPISVPPHLPIYAYVVCDLTPTFQKQAKDLQLTKTPDSQGYFGYHREYGAYIEVVSFDKLIDDAKRRNKILFDKMGLHGDAPGLT
jgi:hypothetical protein